MSELGNLPAKVEKQASFMERFMQMFDRTTILIDEKGKKSYISFPPKKGFSKKQIDKTVAMEVKDLTIFGEDRTSLGLLQNLRELTFGRDVLAIGRNANFGGTEKINYSEDLTQIPEGAIRNSRIRSISGPGVNISITKPGENDKYVIPGFYPSSTDIYLDEENRLHFIVNSSYSMGQDGHYTQENRRNFTLGLAEGLLESSTTKENERSIYIYDPQMLLEDSNRRSIHAVSDSYPMSKNAVNELKDEELVALFLTGAEEVDLADFAKYPNLRKVIIGKDIKTVRGGDEFQKSKSKDFQNRDAYAVTTSNGKRQEIVFLSNETKAANSLIKTPTVPEKTVEREIGKNKTTEEGPEL